MSEDDELSDSTLAELALIANPANTTATIRDAKARAKARKRELLPELAAQLAAAQAALQAAAETVQALADADTVNGLSNHFLIDEDDDAE